MISEIRVYVIYVKSTGTLYYASCQTCLKKVNVDAVPIKCESCRITMDHPKHRYVLSVKVADSTGSLWVTLGDGPASSMLCKGV